MRIKNQLFGFDIVKNNGRTGGIYSLTMFGFCLMLVTGWRGNIYRTRRVLRLNWNWSKWSLFCRPSIEYVSNFTTTTWIYIRLNSWKVFSWNSEHIAQRMGKYHEDDYNTHRPSYHQYKGWLGNHFSG
jgi:hypothetical protein